MPTHANPVTKFNAPLRRKWANAITSCVDPAYQPWVASVIRWNIFGSESSTEIQRKACPLIQISLRYRPDQCNKLSNRELEKQLVACGLDPDRAARICQDRVSEYVYNGQSKPTSRTHGPMKSGVVERGSQARKVKTWVDVFNKNKTSR